MWRLPAPLPHAIPFLSLCVAISLPLFDSPPCLFSSPQSDPPGRIFIRCFPNPFLPRLCAVPRPLFISVPTESIFYCRTPPELLSSQPLRWPSFFISPLTISTRRNSRRIRSNSPLSLVASPSSLGNCPGKRKSLLATCCCTPIAWMDNSPQTLSTSLVSLRISSSHSLRFPPKRASLRIPSMARLIFRLALSGKDRLFLHELRLLGL